MIEPQETDDQKGQRMAIIEAFSDIIKQKRKDAIEHRRGSGIESDWAEDEDHYDGIDDANRKSASKMQKGRTPTDGLREPAKELSTRSTVFLKITRPYVDAAAARVSDMLLPTDDRNFAIRPTPKPMLEAAVAEQPAQQPPQSMFGGVRAAIGQMFGAGQQQPAQMNPALVAQDAIAKAKAASEAAQTTIEDWLVECRYHAEVRKVIETAAKIGTGVLKGPTPTLKKKRKASETPDGWTVEIVETLSPDSKWVDPWNFYPDGACGNNIQNGSYVFECDDITARRLTELKSDPTYITEMIDMCLEEGPISAVDGTRKLKQGEKTKESDQFQIWYFHGHVSKKDMEAAGCSCEGKELYPAVVTMVNDRVIKVTLSPLDSGEFPYDVMLWQARNDHWAGIGISRQMRECQRGANAAVRNLMDNAALSAGPQIIVDRTKIVPANGKWELTPRKIWYSKNDAETDDVRKAFTIVSIETRQVELMNILQFWLKEAEDVTGLPMLLQGQQGGAPDTLGGMQIINNNGSTVLRRIARTFDDRVTEPHIGRYYEWLLMYGPNECKGDFTIDARGSSALVERDAQSQHLVQIMGASLNPAYGLDPELVITEFLKSMRFDPKALTLSDEKKQQMAQRQPPEDPRITAAKITAKTREDALIANAQIRKMEIEYEKQDNDADRSLKERIAAIDAQLESAKLSNAERENLNNIKASLSATALKLQTQTDLTLGAHALAAHKMNTPQVVSPATEPVGRAPTGQAFSR